MSWLHQIILSNVHFAAGMRAGYAGGVVAATDTSVTNAFGGFGLSTGTTSTSSQTGASSSDSASTPTTTYATSDNSATVTWRTDIETSDTPAFDVCPYYDGTAALGVVGKFAHIEDPAATSAIVAFHKVSMNAGTCTIVTDGGPAQVLVFGLFTGTQTS